MTAGDSLKLQGAVHGAPESQPHKNADASAPANRRDRPARESDEQEERSHDDVGDLTAKHCCGWIRHVRASRMTSSIPDEKRSSVTPVARAEDVKVVFGDELHGVCNRLGVSSHAGSRLHTASRRAVHASSESHIEHRRRQSATGPSRADLRPGSEMEPGRSPAVSRCRNPHGVHAGVRAEH